MNFSPLETLPTGQFETGRVLKALSAAVQQLAELKGLTASIPNGEILISTLGLQEAKDSSAIENIVTTHDELFRDARLPEDEQSSGAKEVLRYSCALRAGFVKVGERGQLTISTILEIQAELERNNAGFRTLPGTALKDQFGAVVYRPPDPAKVLPLMYDLERLINDPRISDIHPLIKMALIHHRFEAIHPFYDGNGRTGRIINVLYLALNDLLEIPALYMSRYIITTKSEYYRLLRKVSEEEAWEEWIMYMLKAVEESARDSLSKVRAIREAFLEVKRKVKNETPGLYSQDLLNALFSNAYTTHETIQTELQVSRITASKYLKRLAAPSLQFLHMKRFGKRNYYINLPLYEILTGAQLFMKEP